MALIKCPDCQKEISDSSKKCLHCGCKIKKVSSKKSDNKPIIIGIVAFIVVVIIGLYVFSNINKVEIPNVINLDENTAVSILQSNMLIPSVNYEYNDEVEEGKVIDIDYFIGDKVDKNTVITVLVSKGPSLISSIESTIQWYNISYNKDNWEFTSPYIIEEYLYIECEPTFGQSFTWKNSGFGTASINDRFDKTVPVSIEFSNQEVAANVKQKITLKVSTKDLDVKKPTTLYMNLVGLDNNSNDINIRINFTISW